MKLTHKRCQCRTCGEYFTGEAAFNKHRTGKITNRKCRLAIQMLAAGMVKKADGFWRSQVGEFRGNPT